MNTARGFISPPPFSTFSSFFSSTSRSIRALRHPVLLSPHLLSPPLLPSRLSSPACALPLLAPRLLVGLRLAADHSYQHNYKLGSRLSVSFTSLHPSRRNTRSLSRPGETFLFLLFPSLLSCSALENHHHHHQHHTPSCSIVARRAAPIHDTLRVVR